jgi:hypothetical protein
MMQKGGWDSAADWPFYFMYDDVLTHWPDSKFVLPLRDSEDWYYSWANLLSSNPLLKAAQKREFLADPFDILWQTSCVALSMDSESESDEAQTLKQTCIAGYEKHVARVQRVIPADRLLLFNMSDGYAPLCEFLGKEVPTFPNGTVEPFPHHDTFTENGHWKVLIEHNKETGEAVQPGKLIDEAEQS